MAGWNQNNWGTSFYDPTSQYGGDWAPGAHAATGAGDIYAGQNPETAWTRVLGEMGLDISSNKYQFGRGLWPQISEGYKAALATNPNLKIQDYVQGINLDNIWNNQTQQQRGEQPSRVAPLARTISRGYGG